MYLRYAFMAFICLIMVYPIQAQLEDQYQLIEFSGEMPEEFTTLTNEKLREAVGKISQTESRSSKESKATFYEQSNYYIDELLLSGRVLFNDPISEYLNAVLGQLLSNDPELQKKIKVYPIKSASVNAFATDNGSIFINLGLLAKLKTEAQLAYILAHELSHFTEHHVIEEFQKKVELKSGIDVYKEDAYEDLQTFSKEQELEADELGLELFLKTAYNKDAALQIMDVLAYAHIPWIDKVVSSDFLNSEHFQIPKNYFLDTLQTPMAWDEGSKTHPGLTERKQLLYELVQDEDPDKLGSDFINAEADFHAMQEMCRYELSTVLLQKRDYLTALQTTYWLLKNDPNDIYLKKCMVKALYGIAKYKNYEKYREMHASFEDIEGVAQKFYYLFEKLSAHEASVLALQRIWELKYELGGEDPEINRMAEDMIKELIVEHKFTKVASFRNRTFEVKAGEEESDKKSVTYSLKYLMAKEDFANLVEELLPKIDELKEGRKALSDREMEKLRKRIRSKGYNLGINKMVVVNPFYIKIRPKDEYPLRYAQSEEAQLDLASMIEENGQLLNMDLKVLSDKKLQAIGSEGFNDLVILNQWISERLRHGEVDIVSVNYNRILELTEKYGTSNFYWSGIVGLYNTNLGRGISASKAMLIWAFPLYIPSITTGNNHVYHYSMLFDLEEERLFMYDYNLVKRKDKKAVVTQNVYYNLLQISSKSK